MVWGLSLETFTVVHVVLSLVGIASGFVVMAGFLARKPGEAWNALFLITTVATSVTGFGFPVDRLLPSHVVGIISLVVLAVAIFALYTFHLRDAWGLTYVVSAAAALYLNVFVGVVQAFQRVPVLRAMAPHQTELPFVVAQLVVLAAFIALTIAAARRFARART